MQTDAAAVQPAQRIARTRVNRAGHYTSDRQPADVLVVLQVVGLELERSVGLDLGAGQLLYYRLEHRFEIAAAAVGVR